MRRLTITVAIGALAMAGGCELTSEWLEGDFESDKYTYPRDKSIDDDSWEAYYNVCKDEVEQSHNHRFKRFFDRAKFDEYHYMIADFSECIKSKSSGH